MTQALLTSLALSLLLTLGLEIGFFLLVGRWFTSRRDTKTLLLVVLVNVLTNPLVVLLYWLTVFYTDWNTAIVLIPLELFAVFAEGYYYRKYGACFRRPYLFSIAANAFSFGTGLLIQILFM